jgi:hypothetical protein
MKRIHLVLFALLFALTPTFLSFAQKNSKPTLSRYYISIQGVNSREDVLKIEKLIQSKKGVVFFMAERYPVRCFVLRTDQPTTKSDFDAWLKGTKYRTLLFGEDNKTKELIYLQYKKNKTKSH